MCLKDQLLDMVSEVQSIVFKTKSSPSKVLQFITKCSLAQEFRIFVF